MKMVLFGKPADKRSDKRYEARCLNQIFSAGYHRLRIEEPVNLRCVYFMPDRRPVMLSELLGVTDRILARGCVLRHAGNEVIVAHDGSRVHLDPRNPRVEVYIEGAR